MKHPGDWAWLILCGLTVVWAVYFIFILKDHDDER